jgi:hypothetical protein
VQEVQCQVKNHEEKETDVHFSLTFLEDAIDDPTLDLAWRGSVPSTEAIMLRAPAGLQNEDVDPKLLEAIAAFQSGRLDHGEALLRDIIRRRPQDGTRGG